MKKLICSISFFGILLFANTTIKAEITDDKAISTFDINSMRISDDEMLCWTSTNESGSLPYFVEQFIFNKWVEVAHIDGVGNPEATSYSVQLSLNSGENKFRLKQKGNDKKTRFSKIINYFSDKEAVTYKSIKRKHSIEFSNYTNYILYNAYGKVISQGCGNSINTSDFTDGNYCLIFDNKLNEVEMKNASIGSSSVKKSKKRRAIRNPYSRYKIN